jgi:hypothetical protein
MIKPNTGLTEYLSSIKKTDEDKLKRRRERDKEVFIANMV